MHVIHLFKSLGFRGSGSTKKWDSIKVGFDQSGIMILSPTYIKCIRYSVEYRGRKEEKEIEEPRRIPLMTYCALVSPPDHPSVGDKALAVGL